MSPVGGILFLPLHHLDLQLKILQVGLHFNDFGLEIFFAKSATFRVSLIGPWKASSQKEPEAKLVAAWLL